jgi:protocatechuate 3,4-dioxygenase beta subunit
MSTRILFIAIVICACALVGAAPRAQVRDSRAVPTPTAPKGNAELSVLVTTDEPTPQPLRRVSVAIQAGELDVPHIGVTDDEGRVVFRNLAAGNYLLTATRQGFVRTFYGSSLPGRGPGVAVTVLDGQRMGGVRIRMLRGSVITGTVRTISGRPAPNQQVQAIMIRASGGEKRAVNLEGGLGMAATDDRGVYRIFGLAPGDYLVSIPVLGLAAQELRPMTTEELQWADRVVAAGAAAPAPGLPPAPEAAPSASYSPVYYPGTTVASDAGVLTLAPAEERAGVDFSLVLVPTARVSGRVLDAEGRPQANLSVAIRPTRPDGLNLFSALFNSTGRTTADGTFTINGVKPGAYTVSVRATPRTPGGPPPSRTTDVQQAIAAMMGGGAGGGATHWASEEIAVQGRDVSDLVLALRPGMTVTGRVVYEAATKTPPTDLTKTALALMTAPTGSGMNELAALFTGGGSMTATVAADGTFTIRGVAPGRYRLNTPFGMIPLPMMTAMSGGWTLKSVMAGGRDIADAPIDIKGGADVTDVVVTFTDRPSELSGTVYDGAGRVTPNFPIVVFSTDREYWTMSSRRVQTARPASDGKFTVTGLPAGEYFVCAVTAVDRTEVYDPAFLEQLAPVSFKITIADGEKKVQDLRLGGG